MTEIERWRPYGVNKCGPGTTNYQGMTDMPEDRWLVRESDYIALADQLAGAVEALRWIAEYEQRPARRTDDPSEAKSWIARNWLRLYAGGGS